MPSRDEFKSNVVQDLANRTGRHCSNPECRRETSGPKMAPVGTVNIGVAAHITAAAAGGPRFDPLLTRAQRSAATNGIWLCQSCAKLVDSDNPQFTKELLLKWKALAEERAKALIETPSRPQAIDEPILALPSTDAAVSWLAYSARATTLVGRDSERARLNAFLHSTDRFSWWLMTGPAGTGKSRLALEVCRHAIPAWSAGFLSRAESFTRWSYFRPKRPTLIVIDYVASRAADVSNMVLQLARSTAHFPSAVRVLLVERDRGSWWSKFQREESQSESAELIACRHDEVPLQLEGLGVDSLKALAAEVAKSRQVDWTESMARDFESRMRLVDPLGRPLFAMMAAAYGGNEARDAMVDTALLRQVLTKEAARRRLAMPDEERLRRVENLMVLATLVGRLLPRANGFEFLSDEEFAPLLPDPSMIDVDTYCDMVAASSDKKTLPGLQPDILGERLVLDRLAAGGQAGSGTRRMLMGAWALQPDDLSDFIIRTASDFPGDTTLDVLCDLPRSSVESRELWGRLVGDLVRVANRSTDAMSQRLLGDLRKVAAQFPTEEGLRLALARAEFFLGNVYLFAETDYARASTQYDAAIDSAGAETEIAVAAINNRGILFSEIEDEVRALTDWSHVIQKPGIPDEVRACSLNNRADIFAQRGDHDRAIADRSEVLALKDTSPDRRYIALFRRSRSYVEIERITEALSDLECVLETVDISPHQKAEASVAHGKLLKSLGRRDEARRDFDLVLAEEELFAGTAAAALVELADLARLERDMPRAYGYLDSALANSSISPESTIDALIVRAHLLNNERKAADAERIWQSIIAHPHASIRQREHADRFVARVNS